MGVIRGGFLVIVGVLLFVSLFATYILLTMSWSLNYSNVQEKLGDVIRGGLDEELGVKGLIEEDYLVMKEYCNIYADYVFNYEDTTITIPCGVILQGQEEVIEYGINAFVGGVYYKSYDCSFWDCFSGKEIPFFLVSSKAQSYWYSNFNYALIIVGVLCILGFLLAKKKGNFFILLSALVILAAIPFSKLDWLISLLGDTAEGLLSVFFSKGFAVFIRAVIIGAILLVIGIIFKLFRIGFKIQSIFSKKEEVKEIAREEIGKSKQESRKEIKKQDLITEQKSKPEQKPKKQQAKKSK